MPEEAESGAGARTPLNRERVVRAAVTLADEHGIEALTMRRLGSALGVEAMSLYNHVANKDDILDGLIDLVFEEIGLPARDVDWRTALRRRAVSAREVLMRHRWAVGLMDSRSTPGAATLRHHDTVIGILRASGFSMREIAHSGALLDAYIFGFVLQEKSLPGASPEETEAIVAALLEQLPPDEYPHLRAFTVEHVLQPEYDFGKEFEYGLDLILDGLEREREPQR
ncbi:MAG: TetR/AcrR family transcriptional regulator [Gemmatimonadota bacterium]|nr:TetR/AcrR family transcriptional regulator [Gemmatimonadota bacterium]